MRGDAAFHTRRRQRLRQAIGCRRADCADALLIDASTKSEAAAEVGAALRELYITCTAEDVRIHRLAEGEMHQKILLGKHLRQVIPG